MLVLPKILFFAEGFLREKINIMHSLKLYITPNISFYICIPTTFQLVMSEAYSVDHNIEIYTCNNKFLFTFSVHYSNIKKTTSFFNAKFCKNFVYKVF